MTSIEQLQKSIAAEKARIKKAQDKDALQIEKSKLKKQLFELRKPKPSPTKLKAMGILKRTGRGLKVIGGKATPIIKKQARLIREQQLRDDAIQRKLAKRKKPKMKKMKTSSNPFGNLDF